MDILARYQKKYTNYVVKTEQGLKLRRINSASFCHQTILESSLSLQKPIIIKSQQRSVLTFELKCPQSMPRLLRKWATNAAVDVLLLKIRTETRTKTSWDNHLWQSSRFESRLNYWTFNNTKIRCLRPNLKILVNVQEWGITVGDLDKLDTPVE